MELLGYVPAPGVAGSATVAAIAEGRTATSLPARTGFRSDAFDDQPPQVFETSAREQIHPFKNEWQIGPVKNNLLQQRTPSQAPGQRAYKARSGRFFVFDAAGFNLSKDRLVVFEFNDGARHASKVVNVMPFAGKDGQAYVEVEVSPRLILDGDLTNDDVRSVRTPTISAVVTKNRPAAPLDSPDDHPPRISQHTVYLDTLYRQIRIKDVVIAAFDSARAYQPNVVKDIQEQPVEVQPATGGTSVQTEDGELQMCATPAVTVPVTRLIFQHKQAEKIRKSPRHLAYHFGLVDAGSLTAVGDTELTPDDLARNGGVPILGFVETPPDAQSRQLKQRFLLVDADMKGALIDGRLRFDGAGRASFEAADGSALTEDTYKTPITLYGNLLETTRGETVPSEVLGSGDPRQANQQFALKQKPLTYIETHRNAAGYTTTLSVRVNGQLWKEVKNFFGRGPEDEVYIVRHDDQQNTIITFGDGVRGARLPSGSGNVVASYRYGAGFAAPPAGGIQQLARPAKGLRAVRSPVAAEPGQDPDSKDALRTLAPRSVLSFGRAVSVRDFEAFAMRKKGVLKAIAEYTWIEEAQRAGVQLTYIGGIAEDELRKYLAERAEEHLPLEVNRAVGRRSSIAVDLAYDSRFDRRIVARAVRAALADPVEGVLAPANQEIGGRLWVSRIYQQVQAIEGVAGVQSIVLRVRAMSRRQALEALEGEALSRADLLRALATLGRPQELHLGRQDVVCTPAGTYFDFGGQARIAIRARSRVAPLAQVPRHLEEL